MAENTVVYYGTGRRKNAVARVRIVPGTGKVTINKRDAEEYFGRHQLVEDALAPFKVTDTLGSFDVIALCDGGGITGQSGALRLGIARAPSRGWRLPRRPQARWFPHPRRPRRRAQEVRPQEGPSRASVLQALICRKTFPLWIRACRVSRQARFLYHGELRHTREPPTRWASDIEGIRYEIFRHRWFPRRGGRRTHR